MGSPIIRTQHKAIVSELEHRPSGSGRRLRYGVIGTGMMGREHIAAVLTLNQADITGLYDSNSQSLALAESMFVERDLSVPTCFPSLDAMVSSECLDAFLICTPNFTHRDIFDHVATSGKPIFLEKPMATTLADALYLVKQSQQYSAPVQVGMQYRYKSQYQLALRAVEAGEVGAVHTISLCEYRPPFLSKVDEWNKFNRFSGGTLVEKCCHYFDLLNCIAQSLPARVFAMGGRAVNFLSFEHHGMASDIDDHAMVIVEYENGVKGQFTLNMFSCELYEELMIGGAKGLLRAAERASFNPSRPSSASIQIEVPGHEAYDGMDCTFPEHIEAGGHYGSTLFEHERFYRRVIGEPTDAATCQQGLWAIILAVMAQLSLRSGIVVDVRAELSAQGIDPYSLIPVNGLWEKA